MTPILRVKRASVVALTLAAALQASCGANPSAPSINEPTPPASSGGQSVTQTFTNSAPITIPGGAPNVTQGPANPYPSTIDVSGMPNGIRKVKVTVHDFSHSYPEDVGLLVVGPRGHGAVLMSHAGCGRAVANVILTFDDTAGERLPDASLIFSGTFKPTDHEPGGQFGSPAPSGPHGVRLDVYAGTDPNGTWALYALDRSGNDIGRIGGGWSLAITSGGSPSDFQRSAETLAAPLATSPATPCAGGSK